MWINTLVYSYILFLVLCIKCLIMLVTISCGLKIMIAAKEQKKVRSSDAAKRSIARPNSIAFLHYFSLAHMQLITPSYAPMAMRTERRIVV